MPAALIGDGAVLDTCLVPEGCELDGTVRHSVLFQGVQVDAGASVSDSIVMMSSRVESGAVVERAIVAEDVVVGTGARIGGDGELCVIGANATIMPGAVVEPGETVEPGEVVMPPDGSANEVVEEIDIVEVDGDESQTDGSEEGKGADDE